MSRLLGVALLLAGLLYPFAVYVGREQLSPQLVALLLGALWLVRAVTSTSRPDQAWLAGGAMVFCLLLGISGEAALMLWYPVLINMALLAVFGLSLKHGPPLIERLARLREPEVPPHAVAYTRRVTQVWVAFFVVNLSLTASLALWAPLAWWTLYTGLISYVLMGLLFAGEWIIRQRVRNRQ
jgi:uncharacterized membrane protein